MNYLAIACVVTILGYTGLQSPLAYGDPTADRQAMRALYQKRFPDIPVEAHKDGVYAFDQDAREQWLELEDFPPYEIAIDEGEELFNTALADGASYSDCFGDGAVKGQYPYFDENRSEVITLELAINDCRSQHDDQPLAYNGPEIARVAAYIAFLSRDQIIAVAEPTSPAALAAYNDGKRFYSSRKGQLNFACSSCHVQLAGKRLRSERLSASLGHVTHWPAYRLKWQDVGSLHRRFARCNQQVRAEPFAQQSPEYRNLEYFLTYIANGLPLNGPAIRK
ncbi:MAG: sulfur oxidation c-type cytochrome SoxA [Porticoccaceae bacterium]|nr:sulfur oxidation c-type cytochrome SoxA [Porticoccaceae bacterium]